MLEESRLRRRKRNKFILLLLQMGAKRKNRIISPTVTNDDDAAKPVRSATPTKRAQFRLVLYTMECLFIETFQTNCPCVERDV